MKAATASAALSDKFPPPREVATPLPREVLLHVLRTYVNEIPLVDPNYDWRERMDFLLDCALVSRDWNAAATYILYSTIIILCKGDVFLSFHLHIT